MFQKATQRCTDIEIQCKRMTTQRNTRTAMKESKAADQESCLLGQVFTDNTLEFTKTIVKLDSFDQFAKLHSSTTRKEVPQC